MAGLDVALAEQRLHLEQILPLGRRAPVMPAHRHSMIHRTIEFPNGGLDRLASGASFNGGRGAGKFLYIFSAMVPDKVHYLVVALPLESSLPQLDACLKCFVPNALDLGLDEDAHKTMDRVALLRKALSTARPGTSLDGLIAIASDCPAMCHFHGQYAGLPLAISLR